MCERGGTKSHRVFEERDGVSEAELVEVKRSQEFISNQHDILLAENEELKDLNSKQAKFIHELELKNSKLKPVSYVEDSAKIDDLEQYDRSINLELEAIPFAEKENINEKVTKFINKMGCLFKIGTSPQLTDYQKNQMIGARTP